MDKKLKMEMALQKIEDKYLMRDDKITYELRRYDLSELGQKFLFSLMYKISADFIQPYEINDNEQGKTLIYKFTLDEVKKEIHYDYRIEKDKEKIKKLLKELVSTPITISVFDEKQKRKELVNTNLIEKLVLSDDKEILYISIDERILPLYKATSDKFTIWGFDYMVLSEKKYTPRLYEFLIEFAKSIGTKNINNIISKTISVEDLYFELSIPDSYRYDNIKKSILEPCKAEFLGLNYPEEEREKFKLFKSFDYVEKKSPRISTAGRRAIDTLTFNIELLDKTKGFLRGKKGVEATNPEKLKAREEEKKGEFYYTVHSILKKCEYNPFISKLTGYQDENSPESKWSDFAIRVLDIKNEIKESMNLETIQDVAFAEGLKYTIEHLRNADIEEFEYNFRQSLTINIEYWGKRSGKGKAKPRKSE